MPVRHAVLLMLGVLAAAPLAAAPGLVPFTEAGGCRLRADEATVRRLQQFAAQGSVRWTGACRDGWIDGRGVLREEGTATRDGRALQFAYFLSGRARAGLREGRWTRETFERFSDSPRFYTAASTVQYAAGVARGKPVLRRIDGLGQLTPAFRQWVVDAQRDAVPANAALRLRTETPPAAVPVTPARPAVAPVPAGAPRVTASSQQRTYGPEGLVAAASPGWQSASPPDYPEWIMVDFRTSREVRRLGLLAQDDGWSRAPKAIRVESSEDGRNWDPQIASEIPCAPNADDGWLNLILRRVATGRYLRLVVLDNCGDPAAVALRGLRFD